MDRQLHEVSEWLDSLYVRLQGAELMFATSLGNEAYCESLRADIEQAVGFGILLDRAMEHCGCLFEALGDSEVSRDILLKARSEVNNLSIHVRHLALSAPANSDELKYQAAVDRWNTDPALSWADITEEAGEPRGDSKSFMQSVKRFAERTGQGLREGKPGSKRKSK